MKQSLDKNGITCWGYGDYNGSFIGVMSNTNLTPCPSVLFSKQRANQLLEKEALFDKFFLALKSLLEYKEIIRGKLRLKIDNGKDI